MEYLNILNINIMRFTDYPFRNVKAVLQRIVSQLIVQKVKHMFMFINTIYYNIHTIVSD